MPGLGIPGIGIPFLDPFANLPAWLDRHLLPARHLYHQGFYDPEGLLSSVSAVASTLVGVLAGKWIRGKRIPLATAHGLMLAGCFSLVAGFLWSHWFPLNKRLWTSSFVLWTSGINLCTLVFLPADRHPSSWASVDLPSQGLWRQRSHRICGLRTAGQLARFRSFCVGAIVATMALPSVRVLHSQPSCSGARVCDRLRCTLLIPPWILYRKRVFLKV